MKTIKNPTENQVMMLANLYGTPAELYEEGLCDVAEFRYHGENFFSSKANQKLFMDYAKKNFPGSFKTFHKVINDKYGFDVQDYFSHKDNREEQPEGYGDIYDITNADEYDSEQDCGYFFFKIFCHYALSENQDLLFGMCEEIKEFVNSPTAKEFDEDGDIEDNTVYQSLADYKRQAKEFFKLVDFKQEKNTTSKTKDDSARFIFNGNLPDAKPGRYGKVMSDEEFLKLFELAIFGEEKNISFEQMKNKRIDQFKSNKKFAKAFKDITSKINIDDDVKFYIKELFLTDQMVPYMVLMMTKVNYELKKLATIPAYAYLYHDGKDFRAFVPYKGNYINAKSKSLMDIDEHGRLTNEEDDKYIDSTGYDEFGKTMMHIAPPDWLTMNIQFNMRVIPKE